MRERDTELEIVVTGEPAGGAATVTLRGELDIDSAPHVRQAVETLNLDGVSNVVIALGGVGFIDSTGLGTLVGALKRCVVAGGDLVLTNPQPSILMILEISGLRQMLRVESRPNPGLGVAS